MFKLRLLVVAVALFPVLLLAFSSGPPAGVTGSFGEPNCTDCHDGNVINAPGGSFSISGVPANYTPGGPAIPITVTISKTGQGRWGFELAVRARANGAQAGILAGVGGTTLIQQFSGVQYISHNSSSTQSGAAQGTWSFNWTPPATNVGEVAFSAAGNAANGSGTSSGDFIYVTEVSTQPPAQVTSPLPSKPVITIIPHLVTGGNASGGFVTRVFVNNLSTGSNGVIINIVNQNGTLATAGQEQVLLGGGSLQFSTDEANRFSNQSIQWVAIGSDGPILASVVFDFRFATSPATDAVQVVGVPAQAPGTSFTAPFIFQQETSAQPALVEGLAIANQSSSSNTLTIQLLDRDGTRLSTDTLTLSAFEQKAFVPSDPPTSPLPNLLAQLQGRTAFLGSLVITGTQSFAPVYVGALGPRLFSLPLTGQ